MPNWCQNRVSIYCQNTEVLDKIEKIFSKENPFQEIFPLPEDQADNWYDWCVENWGTKWDIDQADIERFENELTLYFETAWSPAEGIKDKLEETYDNEDISISWFYDEPMMQMAGYL